MKLTKNSLIDSGDSFSPLSIKLVVLVFGLCLLSCVGKNKKELAISLIANSFSSEYVLN